MGAVSGLWVQSGSVFSIVTARTFRDDKQHPEPEPVVPDKSARGNRGGF